MAGGISTGFPIVLTRTPIAPGRFSRRPHVHRVLVAAIFAGVLFAAPASAQPQISLSTTVRAPGETVSVTITGVPGAFFAVLGSSMNGGFSYAGVALGVGSDVVILAQGVISGSGEASMQVVPPFNGTVLDRYYLQAVDIDGAELRAAVAVASARRAQR